MKIAAETMTNLLGTIRPVGMKIFIKLAIAMTIMAFAHATPSANASTKLSFEFTCETAEAEFYDWIETEFWPKASSATFGRNLDAAFDVLTSTAKNAWEVTIPDMECASDVLLESRREALYLMLEDAAQDGYGRVRREP